MAAETYYDHCLCCGSAAISKVFTCKDYTVSGENFEIWQCNSCTFRFTQNAPAEGDIGKYYQSVNYISHSDIKQGFVNSVYHGVRNFTLKSKQNLVRKVTGLKKGTLLDVGAGTGAFASAMQQAGWSVMGLEPDETARANAFNNYKLKLHELSNLQDLEENSFDAITLWHVLEHVHDLHGYLGKFYKILKPEGRLIIAVPNYTSYDATVYKQFWAAYDVPRHLYHFSPKSMQILLEKKGFNLESVRPMWFDSFYVSMLSEKYKQGKDRFVSALLIGMFSNIKALFSIKRCSSVIYVVKKNQR